MSYKRTDNGEVTVVQIDGTLDAVTAPEFRTLVDELVAENRADITLELSGLRLIDSSGVGVVVSLFKRIRANGGQVRIVGLRDQPRAIFRLLRLDRVFPT
ncbi:STAS domain-containing protein [Chondromyces apiculatus]|uniref:Anti-sigma factor antagonist n=1 Tax=Chondromyces apiculatus DSM 436 TaxID=1192034 RepID=A0A017T2K3_9BACT|nr:STAS domain-containing protein [Chondromyces apiculatus]EYF03035.1 Anti-sigma F factor antagonist / Anti-sigma B factor antagonist RsbV [Chondromyces apiculatus DSM 436]